VARADGDRHRDVADGKPANPVAQGDPAGPARLRLVDDPAALRLGHGPVGLVLEIHHGTPGMMIPNRAEEGHDPAMGRGADRPDQLQEINGLGGEERH
jgi:hypothetical protein